MHGHVGVAFCYRSQVNVTLRTVTQVLPLPDPCTCEAINCVHPSHGCTGLIGAKQHVVHGCTKKLLLVLQTILTVTLRTVHRTHVASCALRDPSRPKVAKDGSQVQF